MALRRIFSAVPRACPQSAVGGASAAAVQQHMPQLVQKRHLNIHEYQSAALMAEMGVNVPFGIAASTVSEAVEAAKQIGDDEVVIKSQILAGGRGLGKFTNGLQGGVHVIKTSEVEKYASQMLGGTLVTKQSGAAGKPVNQLLLAKKMDLVNEMYFAILLDRASGGPVIIACSEGGTSIEDLAESNPDAIVKVPIHPIEGITEAQAIQVVEGLKVTTDKGEAVKQVTALYDLFCKADCTMVEVNPLGKHIEALCMYWQGPTLFSYVPPLSNFLLTSLLPFAEPMRGILVSIHVHVPSILAEDSKGTLMAADAKIGFDDNAEFRQKDIFAKRDESQEDPREVAASKVSAA